MASARARPGSVLARVRKPRPAGCLCPNPAAPCGVGRAEIVTGFVAKESRDIAWPTDESDHLSGALGTLNFGDRTCDECVGFFQNHSNHWSRLFAPIRIEPYDAKCECCGEPIEPHPLRRFCSNACRC